jgi:ATP-dependent helicase HepA
VVAWAPGDRLAHRHNPELGIGRVIAVEGRTIVVEFPGARTLRLSSSTGALQQVPEDAETAPGEPSLLERLAAGDVDDATDFLIRLDILRLKQVREAGGLGSFLGGRVRLYPHQLYVAERATRTDPVRWLLADEVGLGKTIEAALILNRLVHMRRVERCLVVAPEALTVQWLGELWRKYHQVFTLLDAKRLADVERDFGAGFNPFDAHRRVVIALETLIERPELTDAAVRAGIDLLVVDEAQRLRRPPGHPGEPGYRAIAPIAALNRHVLLLSATPLDDDAHGFFRLLQLLRPDEFPEDGSFEDRLARGTPLPDCTSSTRRSDIGGLPPRVGIAVDLDGSRTAQRDAIEATLREAPAPHAVARRQKADRIRRLLASGAALHAVLRLDESLRRRTEALDASDARLEWLLARAPRWRAAGDKTLVFVEHRETLEMLRTLLSHRGQLATGVFHEELSAVRRDTEVARFREPRGPSLLISTEAGGEGRNFEFCRRIVLFDLPWKPTVVEQRIGRLDRIGRRIPVDVVYFRPAAGVGRWVAQLLEAVGVFHEPLAGLEPQLAHIEPAIEEMALDPSAALTPEHIDALLETARSARTRIREAAYQQLHRSPYRAEMAAGILSRVPAQLDALNERAVITACARLGFTIERPRGGQAYAIEIGNHSLVDKLPGVASGASFVGTFDREEAVEDETIDFFASGHPLVEGVFAYFEESWIGRVARLEITIDADSDGGAGLLAVYADEGGFDVVALDASGHPRPAWREAVLRGQFPAGAMPSVTAAAEEWSVLLHRAAARLDANRTPQALAAIFVRSPTSPPKVSP